MTSFSFQTDDDTIRLFQIVVWCLKKYFNLTEESAIGAINSYYEKNLTIHDDDWYHHEMAFPVAVRIYYFEILKENPDQFLEWRKESCYKYTPREAINYFKEHYFD